MPEVAKTKADVESSTLETRDNTPQRSGPYSNTEHEAEKREGSLVYVQPSETSKKGLLG